MGLFDAIKNRLGGGQEEYVDDDQYLDDQENYETDYEETSGDESYYDDDQYYDDASGGVAVGSNRRIGVFNQHAPLISMSDVRSQELPRYTPDPLPVRTPLQSPSQIRTSLPYISNPAENPRTQPTDPSLFNTGQFSALGQRDTAIYANREISDPLLKRHSLSNTGDFSATSPAYYASRSGVGHVRPVGQVRRSHKNREIIIVTPASYSEAEIVAANLRRENAVVLVLTQTRPELAKRILDFSFGAAAVMEANVQSIGERVYAIVCGNSLTSIEIEFLRSRGIL